MKTVTIKLFPENSISRRFDLSDSTEDINDNSMLLYHLNTPFSGWVIIELRIIGGFIYFPNPVCPPDVWKYLADFFRLPVAPLSPAMVKIRHMDYDDIDESVRYISGHINSFGFFIVTHADGDSTVIPYSHYDPLVIDGKTVTSHSLTDCLVSPRGRIFPIDSHDARNWILSPQLALRKNQRLQDLRPRAEELMLMPYLSTR
jgi:hypothetical protein